MIERMFIMDTSKMSSMLTLVFIVFSDAYLTSVIAADISAPPPISSSSFSPLSSSLSSPSSLGATTTSTAAAEVEATTTTKTTASSTTTKTTTTTLVHKAILPIDNDILKDSPPSATDVPLGVAAAPATSTAATNVTSITSVSPTTTDTDILTTDEDTSSMNTTDDVTSSSIETTSFSLDSTSISGVKTTSSSTMSSEVPIVMTSTADMTSSDSTTSDASQNNLHVCPDKTVFGEYGLLAFLIIAIVCVMLMLILLILVVKVTRRKTSHIPDEEKNPPKLKLIEVREIGLKNHAVRKNGDDINSSNDGLQTYSLDYEKHVQEKIEEHRRKTRAPSNQSQGMSTFMVGKKPSLMSNHSSVSSSSSPRSPASPIAEQQALLSHKDEESPVVFNFTKKPGESLAERRSGTNYDPAGDRRRSNVTSGKKKINTEV